MDDEPEVVPAVTRSRGNVNQLQQHPVSEELPDVPDDGLLVKKLYALISHVTTDKPSGEGQHVEGHSVCAKVLAVGAKVPDSADCDLRVGDVIVVYPWPGCGQCETCSAGNFHLCDEVVIKHRLPSGHVAGINEKGDIELDNFQVVSDWQHAVRLPREVSRQVGCHLPCGALRVYTALLDARPCFEQAVRIRGFANLLIVCGDRADGLEIWGVKLMKSVFCDRNVKVLCTGLRRDVIDRAVESGCDDVIHLELPPNADQSDRGSAIIDSLVDQVTMSGYNRMDVTIDLAGDPLSFNLAVRSLHIGGTVFELGNVFGRSLATSGTSAISDSIPPLDLHELVARSITLRTIPSGSVAMLRQLIDVIGVQRVNIDTMPVEYFRPTEYRSAVERYRSRLAKGPVVIQYE